MNLKGQFSLEQSLLGIGHKGCLDTIQFLGIINIYLILNTTRNKTSFAFGARIS